MEIPVNKPLVKEKIILLERIEAVAIKRLAAADSGYSDSPKTEIAFRYNMLLTLAVIVWVIFVTAARLLFDFTVPFFPVGLVLTIFVGYNFGCFLNFKYSKKYRSAFDSYAEELDALLCEYKPVNGEAFDELKANTLKAGMLTKDALDRWLAKERGALSDIITRSDPITFAEHSVGA